jgi:hypothetical protein
MELEYTDIGHDCDCDPGIPYYIAGGKLVAAQGPIAEVCHEGHWGEFGFGPNNVVAMGRAVPSESQVSLAFPPSHFPTASQRGLWKKLILKKWPGFEVVEF